MQNKGRICVATFTMVLLLLCSACAQRTALQDEQPKGDIVIGIFDDFSGPLAGSGAVPYKDALLIGVRYINEEQGGILGHQLRAIVIDNKVDSALILSGWDRLKNENASVILTLLSGAASPIIQSAADEDHIPIVAGSGSVDQVFPKEPSFFFARGPQPTGVFGPIFNMIEKDWAQKGQSRPPKIGVDAVSLGIYPKMFGKATKLQAEKRGWEYILTRTPLMTADVTTQVLQVKEFGCDYLYLTTTPAMIVWLKDLERQNFKPQIYGVPALGTSEVRDAVGDLIIGTIPYLFSPSWDETYIPIVSLLHGLNAKWYPDVIWRDSRYSQGFPDILVLSEAMKRVIEDKGYGNLNGDSMKDSMEAIGNFDPGLGIGYTWTPNDHQGVQGVRWYQWTSKDKFEPLMKEWDVFEPLPEEQRTNAWWLTD